MRKLALAVNESMLFMKCEPAQTHRHANETVFLIRTHCTSHIFSFLTQRDDTDTQYFDNFPSSVRRRYRFDLYLFFWGEVWSLSRCRFTGTWIFL